MKRKLNEQQILFCEEYIRNGYKQTEAYRFAFPDANANTSRCNASKMLKNPMIQDKLEEVEGSYKTLAFEKGLDKNTIINVLKEMMNATKTVITKTGEMIESPDWGARKDAILTLTKLNGELTERKKIEIDEKESLGDEDIEKMTPEQLKEYEVKLLESI